MDKIPIELSGPPQTMLATLYAEALDADADRPVLGDTWARDAVARIDYDWFPACGCWPPSPSSIRANSPSWAGRTG